jgi:CRISPR system Cascade subunit CasB
MSDNFIERLSSLADDPHDRAPLAALRRGASGEAHDLARVCPYVLPFAPNEPRKQQAYLDVACLFGLHPTPTAERARGLSLADALRSIKVETDSTSIEQRFVALLQSHREELLTHVRYCVALARSHEKTLRWDDVLDALVRWDNLGMQSNMYSPQRKWAQDFWGQREQAQ